MLVGLAATATRMSAVGWGQEKPAAEIPARPVPTLLAPPARSVQFA